MAHHSFPFLFLQYFTGNGWFNRSMRLWATVKFGYQLSDHGIFQRGTKTRVLQSASTEKEVFDFLQMVWKEPYERNCFNDVIPTGQGSFEVSESDFYNDIPDLPRIN